jgi:hypothetical protein
LTFTGETNFTPRYSADGRWLLWLASDGHRIAHLREQPVGGDARQARDVVHLDGLGGYALLSDGSLVFEQSRAYAEGYFFQDLFRWDRASGRVTQLTRKRRARDPAVSPDERRVAYSQNLTSTSVLAVMPLAAGGEGEVLWRGERFDQAYQPAWSPDGATLAFSAWRRGGYRDILLVDVASRRVTEVTRDRALDGSPVFSPDGRWLYFESDRSGISNIYAWDRRSGELWQVTDEIGGAYEPEVSPDGTRLVYRGNVAEGYDLFEVRVAPSRAAETRATTGAATGADAGAATAMGVWLETGSGLQVAAAEGVPAGWRRAVPYLDDRPPPTEISDDEVVVSAPRPYRALESLAPPAWTYEALASAKGSYTVVRTSGSDTAGLHSYSLSTGINLPRGELNVAGSYAYGGLRPGLRLSAARTASERATGYRVNGRSLPYRDEIWSGSISLAVPGQRKPDSSWFLSFDYSLDYTRLLEAPPMSPAPDDILTRAPLTDYAQSGLGVRLTYSALDSTLHGVGPQRGADLSLGTRLDLPELGATYRALSVSYTARWFRQLPGWLTPGRALPSVALRLNGALRAGDLTRTGSFGLGGFPEQDLVSAVLERTRASSTGVLRGYPARAVAGNQYHLFNGELRHLLWNTERGLSTLPFYVQRLHVAMLWDAAAAWDTEPTRDALRTSLGAAVRLDAVFGYFVAGTFELGYARGLTAGGVGDGWLLLTGTL